MALSDMLKQVLDIGVLLLAEAAVLLNFLVYPLHMHFKVTLAQAVKCAMLTVELFPGVFPHMDTEIGLDSAGIVTLAAFERLLIGVDSQVGLKGMFELENLVAVFTGENFQLGLPYPV